MAPPVRWLVAQLPTGWLSGPLAYSILRVQAVLELRLHNPWTQSDLYARWLAALAMLLGWGVQRLFTKQVPAELRAPRLGFVGLLVFFVGAAAVGAVVLVLYDAALLYNLGHLRAHLGILGVSLLQSAALIFPTAALAVCLLDGLLGGIGTGRRIRG